MLSSHPVTFDRAHLVDQTGGDADLGRELLALFEHECSRLVPLVSGGTPVEQSLASHTLKGAALAIGAFRVAQVADAIETLVDRDARRATDELVRALRTAVDELRFELLRIEREG